MQIIKTSNIFNKICLTLLSLAVVPQIALGFDSESLTYLDSVSSSYLHDKIQPTSSILNMNSPEAQSYEATIMLGAKPVITNSQEVVNLSLREADIRQSLRMLADKAKVNIAFDESVEGKITIDLNDVSINDAFLIIFKSARLSYIPQGNTIIVATSEAAKDLPYLRNNMTIIPVKYVNAEVVASFLNHNIFEANVYGLSNKPVVTSNLSNNQLIVFGSDADVNMIKRVLPTIDVKPLVNSFKVSHVTPKEMGSLICKTLLGQQNSQSSDQVDSSTEDSIAIGGGAIACTASSDAVGSQEISALQTPPLTVVYFSELGRVSTYGGSVEQIETIRDFIKEHDRKQLMAYIELSVIELNESGIKTFSNEWTLWTPFIKLSFNAGSGLTTSDSLSGIPGIYLFGKNEEAGKGYKLTNNKALLYTLNYLIDNGNGRVLTNPKIMVTNGQLAKIDMTSDYVKSVTSQVLQGSDSVTSATQRSYDIGTDEGIYIEILPFISPEGYVSINITPEFATIKRQITVKDELGNENTEATLLQRRDLELKNIRIKDGETLVLAGLIKDSETQSIKKMPILSDLPVIGSLFRSSSNTKTREELVIVVTPHIVKDRDEIADNQIYDL